MAGRQKATFQKRQKEAKRREKQRLKMERRAAKRQERAQSRTLETPITPEVYHDQPPEPEAAFPGPETE